MSSYRPVTHEVDRDSQLILIPNKLKQLIVERIEELIEEIGEFDRNSYACGECVGERDGLYWVLKQMEELEP